jgi:hypothetical protein
MENVLDRPDPAPTPIPAAPHRAGTAARTVAGAAEAAGAAAPTAIVDQVRARTGLTAAVPRPVGAALLGTTAVVVGLLWDISWHATIGRDTFWTPAHLAIYLGGLLCGLAAGWTALSTTFGGTAEQRAVAVDFWGFRAPLGAWVAIWGSIAMLASAPFDNWWHDAYGLDVKIISPPHLLLAAGILATQIGAMLQAVAAQNRAGGGVGRALAWAYAYAGGLLLVLVSTLFLEYSEPNRQHGALFYEICCTAYPLVLVGVTRASLLRWPATTVAGICMAVRLAMTWVLPLFAATPRLAPIYNPVHHMWPPFFPELLVVPAFAIDLLLRRAGRLGGPPDAGRRSQALPGSQASLASPALREVSGTKGPRGPAGRTALALGLGAAFLALLVAVQWYFSELMLTSHARNWFFAADQWTYRAHPGAWRHQFWRAGDAPFGPRAAALSLLLATASARLGLAWGDWLARIRR